jgi:nucleotidyltransferase/DNA polymerase involved in DNA repair
MIEDSLQKRPMQQYTSNTINAISQTQVQPANPTNGYAPAPSVSSSLPTNGADPRQAERAGERARLRQGVMHVRIRHFYCTLEEMYDATLRGQAFVVGTGTGRPNEPGRVIDASPAAVRLGIAPGMPLRRAHRIAPRALFLPASYDRYQPILQRLRDRYRAYSRIIESLPIADTFIDLQGCEIAFDSPVALAERLCAEIAEMGMTALIGIAKGKAIAELAALMSRKDGRQGVLYIPAGREASFVQTLPLSLLLQLRSAGTGAPEALPELEEREESPVSRPSQAEQSIEGKSEQFDTVAIAELVTHLRDFGIVSFAQVAQLTEEGLYRRLGNLGRWLYKVSLGQDGSLVVPDAPPLSQNARVRFSAPADADETCAAISKLAHYLGERLRDQRLKGKATALILWPQQATRRETRRLLLNEEGEEAVVTPAEETLGGQLLLSRHTDDIGVLTHHALMLFAQHHRPENRYLQVQLRIGDIVAVAQPYYPPPARSRGRATRKL